MEDEENRKQKEEEEEEQNNPMKVWLLWRFWLNEFNKGGSNKTRHLNPEEWLESNFSLQHHCWVKQYGYESEENDGSIKKKLVIVKQILLVSTIGNVYEAVWRIYILNWWCKRFRKMLKNGKVLIAKLRLSYSLIGISEDGSSQSQKYWDKVI